MKFFYALLSALFLFLISLPTFALPNPAAVNCTKNGYQYIMIRNTGFCLFGDGSYCEEWAYARGKCQSGQYFFPGKQFKKSMMNRYCVYRKGGSTTVKWCRAY